MYSFRHKTLMTFYNKTAGICCKITLNLEMSCTVTPIFALATLLYLLEIQTNQSNILLVLDKNFKSSSSVEDLVNQSYAQRTIRNSFKFGHEIYF